MAQRQPDGLAAWFDRLVKAKLTALAIPVSGMAVSAVLLVLAERLQDWVRAYVEYLGVALVSLSAALFAVAMTALVARHLASPAIRPNAAKRVAKARPEDRPPSR